MATLPDVFRVILVFASLVSFIPQYRHSLSSGDCVGIAPTYVLFNLIAATEQFVFGLHMIVNNVELFDGIVHTPPTLGDWLNLTQFAVVWLCHLGLFLIFLYLDPPQSSVKGTMIVVYASFLSISFVPVLFEARLPPTDSDPYHDRRWVSAIFANTHMFLIHPVVTVVACAAFFPQLHQVRYRLDPSTLSVDGLAVQAAVFFAVAMCWPLRMSIPFGVRWFDWYSLVGWATVDNGVFAFAQAVLYCFARRHSLGWVG